MLQPDLFASRPAPAADDIAWLERLLLDGKCWMTAKDISLTTQGGLLDRDIRELASYTTMIIIGNKGYLHIRNATREEAEHSVNRIESQSRKMHERAQAIRLEIGRVFLTTNT